MIHDIFVSKVTVGGGGGGGGGVTQPNVVAITRLTDELSIQRLIQDG
jgi:hypothetical protein